jgi:hypothetical protein
MQGRKKKPKEKSKVLPSFNLEPYTLNLIPCPSKKKRCPDCHYCQGCSQDRCRLCRSTKKASPKKLSMAEQIALYERLNRKRGNKKK